ncbi:MAG: type I-C CRISPR-associated endonuclease Cas1c [Thermoguttaceae bacterium]|jgi:CRISPR-associated protein Cas1|nr:type I-C CRISPR-associated endonuclease Cas1c [Thermoguttaceae bacterium]
MHQILNTLYVMTQGAFLHLDHDTLKVKVQGQCKLQAPLLHLGGICCFGRVSPSVKLIHRCADDGRSVVFFDPHGRFKGRLSGPVSGNVLLRRAQHLALSDETRSLAIAKNLVAGKIQNARQSLLRARREAAEADDAAALDLAARELGAALPRLERAAGLDEARGIEGEAARAYFAVFDRMIREDRPSFALSGRTRRPPRDRTNALLSFLYALLVNDCASAAEGVGLDPQVGFLHALRSGRPALALDLMEELRPVLADRLALTLINRRQVTAADFEARPGGAVLLTDKGRKTVVVAYQKRKQDEVHHPVVDQKMLLGLVAHTQARLLARHLRGDLEAYPPFLYR